MISGSKSIKVPLESNQIWVIRSMDALDSVEQDNNGTTTLAPVTPAVQIVVNRSVTWDYMVVKGGIAVNVDIQLAPTTAIDSLKVIIHKDDSFPAVPDLNVCKFRVTKVGVGMPCSCVEIDDMNRRRVTYTNNSAGTAIEQASIDFNAVSVLQNQDTDVRQRTLSTNFVVNIEQDNNYDMYPMLVDVVANDQVILSRKINFTIANPTSLSDAVLNMQPKLNITLKDEEITPGWWPLVAGRCCSFWFLS